MNSLVHHDCVVKIWYRDSTKTNGKFERNLKITIVQELLLYYIELYNISLKRLWESRIISVYYSINTKKKKSWPLHWEPQPTWWPVSQSSSSFHRGSRWWQKEKEEEEGWERGERKREEKGAEQSGCESHAGGSRQNEGGGRASQTGGRWETETRGGAGGSEAGAGQIHFSFFFKVITDY